MRLKTWIAIGTFAFTAWRSYRGMKRNARVLGRDARQNARMGLRRLERAI